MKIRVYVCRIISGGEQAIIDKYVSTLSPWRREKAEKLKDIKKAAVSVAAGVLLDKALQQFGMNERDMKYCMGENGKPRFCGGVPFCFSLSHSGNIAVCCISDVETGCDVEIIRSINERVVKKYFNEQEQKSIHDDESFTRFWTRKESILKADGCGIAKGIKEAFAENDAAEFRGKKYYLHEYRFENSIITCACIKNDFEDDLIHIKL